MSKKQAHLKDLPIKTRDDLRNVAIIAHVDHGKTTLVDAMLWQSGAFAAHKKQDEGQDRMMDSMDLEREKGITILAKNTAVKRGDKIVNIIDTPGHADFGGEVERGLEMVDGVILLVDASEGPLPQTRFVLRKALQKNLPVILLINKVDRPDSRIAEVVDEAYALFLDLDANEDQIEFPIVYASAKAGRASLERPADGGMPKEENLDVLFDTIFSAIPAPQYHEGAPLQAHVTNLDSSPFLGRLALCRVREGVIKKGQTVTWIKTDGSMSKVKVSELLARQVKNRLDAELVGNVSLRVLNTDRPDTWEVQGRGELQLAVLVEIMKREGFELTVGKPQVVTKMVDGKLHEPMERLSIDAPEEYLGVITQLMALRTRSTGSLVSDRLGVVTSYALYGTQDRGSIFVEPGDEVYEGMVIGENSRSEDMDVNCVREKKLTNMRASGTDESERLIPAKKLNMEGALEFCREDECVEVTPAVVRIRKVILDGSTRARITSKAKRANENS